MPTRKRRSSASSKQKLVTKKEALRQSGPLKGRLKKGYKAKGGRYYKVSKK